MRNDGFTLIELLVVIGIVAILALMSSPFLSNFIARNNLENTTFRVISSIRKAQNYSIENKDNSSWGICLSSTNIRIYTGSCTTPTIKEDFSFPGNVMISGLTDTIWSKLRGEPSSAISLTISNSSGTRSISVNSAGGMTIN